MQRFVLAFLFLSAVSVLPAVAQPAVDQPAVPTQEPAAGDAASGHPYSVATTTIGTLLDTPALKGIFVKYLPDIANNPQIDQGRDLTLPEIVQYAPEITPEVLSAIDTELKAVPQQ